LFGVRMVKRGLWIVALVVVMIGALIAVQTHGEQARQFLHRWSFTRSVDVQSAGDDRATYYRLKVSLAYKGEPLEFDIVVGCNARITTYKDNDRTVESGVVPMVFGLKMKDGHGVVVKPPEACDGETTENGRVPKALLPLIVTYENADAPWFAIAYASEEAYDSPLSELNFFGASISKATRDEWQRWRRTEAPKNFVTYHLLGINEKNPWDKPHWKPGFRAMGSICAGFSRVKLPESAREAIRPYWPASKPDYWYPNQAASLAVRAAKSSDPNEKELLFEGSPLRQYFPTGANFLGLPRRKPGAVMVFNRYVVGEVYPASSDLSLNRLDAAGELLPEIKSKSEMSRADAIVRPQLKGFAYCDVVDNIDDIPTFINDPGAGYMNRMKINGEAINEDLSRIASTTETAYERDKYVYFYKIYSLVNIFGGL
jgi:hypothetical protein